MLFMDDTLSEKMNDASVAQRLGGIKDDSKVWVSGSISRIVFSKKAGRYGGARPACAQLIFPVTYTRMKVDRKTECSSLVGNRADPSKNLSHPLTSGYKSRADEVQSCPGGRLGIVRRQQSGLTLPITGFNFLPLV